jgi:hypothetical protein
LSTAGSTWAWPAPSWKPRWASPARLLKH